MSPIKDFDVARSKRAEKDRTFRIGGETFSYQPAVRPEVLFRGDSIEAGMPASEVVAISDEMILAFLEEDGDAHERWINLRQRKQDPITVEDMTDLIAWLIEEQTGRPPTQSEPSAPGPQQNGTSSTDVSSPAQAEV